MLKNKLVIGKFSDMVKQTPRFKKSENAQICFPQKIVIYVILPPSMHCTLSCPRVNILS